MQRLLSPQRLGSADGARVRFLNGRLLPGSRVFIGSWVLLLVLGEMGMVPPPAPPPAGERKRASQSLRVAVVLGVRTGAVPASHLQGEGLRTIFKQNKPKRTLS